MTVLNHTVQDYFPIDSPIYYDQGWYYDTSGLLYDGSMAADSGVKAIQPTKSDSIAIVDSAVETLTFLRSFDETLTITDNGEVKAFGQSQADTFSLADVKVIAIAIPKTDSITIVDLLSKEPQLPLSEAFTITDSDETKAIRQVQADTLALVDTLGKTYSQIESDSITFTDAGETKEFIQVQSDSIIFTDDFSFIILGGKPIIFIEETIPMLTINKENVIINIDENKPIISEITQKEY